MQTSLFEDLRHIGPQTKIICLSTFLFVFWRGLGGDTFFSIYTNTIVHNVFLFGVVGSFFSLVRMIINIPIGTIDDQIKNKDVLLIGKLLYIAVWILYFLAGFYSSPRLLVAALIVNGIANPLIFTTYQNIIRRESLHKNVQSLVFGLFRGSLHWWYLVWALIASLLIRRIPIHVLFLFVSLVAIISGINDLRLKEIVKEKTPLDWGTIPTRRSINLRKTSFQNILKIIHERNGTLRPLLLFQALNWLLEYTSFLFIPLLSSSYNFTLPEIAIIFAIMRLPYIIGIGLSNLGDHVSTKTILLGTHILMSICFLLLSSINHFRSVIVISFLISLGIATSRPVLSGAITHNAHTHKTGIITWLQEFSVRWGEIIGSLLFGVLSSTLWLQAWFLIFGLGIWIVCFTLRMKKD